MARSPNQTTTGKAFEYALLKEFKEKLEGKTTVKVVQNEALDTAKNCFKTFNRVEQSQYLLTASFAVNSLIDIEPRLSNSLSLNDILELEILTDRQGQIGDVRDLLIIRLVQEWEIGVSAKNNHRALKHSRLSNRVDFGEKWLGMPCSAKYFNEIKPIFDNLSEIREKSKSRYRWSEILDKDIKVYRPVLGAFQRELERLYKNQPKEVSRLLVEHIVGKKDFYKVIKLNNKVEIQAYNLHGTLNLAFKNILPKYKTPVIGLPESITDISFKANSNNTILITFDKGWKLSFRIHNASSKVEPSLKFDVSLLEAPKTLFVNTLKVIG